MFNVSAKATVDEASYRLIDFFTLELLALVVIVLLAIVLVAGNTKSR